MNVDGKLVAVVGPNESGKSSFLEALVHLNHRGLFVTSGGSQDTTLNEVIPPSQDVIEAKYLLDDADRAALSQIPGGDEVRWFTTAKRAVPGLSKVDQRGIIVLDREAPRTVYLLDSDEGGDELHRKLRGAGIPDARVFHIPDDGRTGLVLEDLIDKEVHVRSVNKELHRSQGSTYSFPAERLPASGRPAEVEAWCNENGVTAPKKTAVAYRILEEGVGDKVLAEHHRESIRRLFENIKHRTANSAYITILRRCARVPMFAAYCLVLARLQNGL